MRRWLILTYGIACYTLFLAATVYLIGFLAGWGTPTTLDGPVTDPLGRALAIDLGLLAVFGVQHSVMARPGFKQWWTRLVPPALERSTYVLATNLALAVLFWQWRPIGGVVWEIESPAFRGAVWALFALGWVVVLVTTHLIDHFDLFGLRQTWLAFRGRPYTPPAFVMPGPYRIVRHPLYIGWLLTFWAAPTMTVARLLFAAGLTMYILLAIRWEERDLLAAFPSYADYRRRVPMLLPRWRRSAAA